MASIADHGNDKLPIFPVICKYAFETVTQSVKVFILGDRGLQDSGSDSGSGLVLAELTALRFEKVLCRGLMGEDIDSGRVNVHARLSSSRHLGRHRNPAGQQLFAAGVSLIDVLAEVFVVTAGYHVLILSYVGSQRKLNQ